MTRPWAGPTNTTVYPSDLIGKLLVGIAAGSAGGILLALLKAGAIQ